MADLAQLVKGGRYLPDWLIRFGEKKLGLHALNVAHAHIEDDWDAGSTENFFKLACQYLGLNYDLEGLENIPATGPCVIVSNHPHGMSDGLMFGDVAMKVRSDIRVLVNDSLDFVRGMRPYQIKVDVYGGNDAKRANMAGMREMLRWLKDGHCLLVFPAGSVATYSWRDGRVIDDPWQTNIATIIRKTGATVVPMHISGRTGVFFQVMSCISRRLRGNFLSREILRDIRTHHKICLGKALPPAALSSFETDEQLSDHLRLQCMLLRYPARVAKKAARDARHGKLPTGPRDMQEIAPHEPQEVLESEIAALPEEDLYYTNDRTGLCVYAVEAHKIPHLVQEIGVLREELFRSVGEGTGMPRDLDEFDPHYIHLIMWDTRAKRIAGAYRIGRTDIILKEKGAKGLYNSMFFRFSPKLLKSLSAGLEMGRAFVAPAYQKLAASLDTLWMGIGHYLVRHPQYRYLYGNVGISNDYSVFSRSVMLSYLMTNAMHEEFGNEAKAVFPPTRYERLLAEDARLLPTAIPDAKALTTIVSSLEEDGKGIPVLLRQYLRLGGRMVAFGVDKDFGNTLDCFVVVDLTTAPERTLQRYMGK